MTSAHDPFIRPMHHFDGARSHARPTDRLRAVRAAAERLHEEMLSAAPVSYFRSVGLRRVPYPTRYAFRDACSVPTPFVHIVNRLFVVQTPFRDEVRTILYSPSDVVANGETPFFKRLGESARVLGSFGESVLSPTLGTVEERIAEIGLAPEHVDYISYDHLHTQDIRKWLGTGGQRGYFPNAKLLVMKKEWESAHGLLPTQADWYCPGGLDGVDLARIVLLDGDVMLGESIALVHTPGHTEGNHSFVTRTPEGVMVTSENGVGCDAYAPHKSQIPGVAKYARATGAEVVLNGNTLEDSVDQYISMVAEKTIAGPSKRDPEFFNVVPSSELGAYWAFPGIKPTFSFGDLRFGQPNLVPRRHAAAAETGDGAPAR
jgi:glyoxylase-like metal-dependent hydrolase (beta-lactamase superfamily II)